MPARIEAPEAEQHAVSERSGDPAFYKPPAAAITAAFERVETIERDLAGLYARWDALDSRLKSGELPDRSREALQSKRWTSMLRST